MTVHTKVYTKLQMEYALPPLCKYTDSLVTFFQARFTDVHCPKAERMITDRDLKIYSWSGGVVLVVENSAGLQFVRSMIVITVHFVRRSTIVVVVVVVAVADRLWLGA